MVFKTRPHTAEPTTIIMGESDGTKVVRKATTKKIIKVGTSMTPPLKSFITDETIRALTAILIAAKALATTGRSIKPSINMAIMVMMIIEGVMTPKAAAIEPAMPLILWPINVAVLTAIMPGVHCPRA